jgi:hypothetical protein
MVGRRPPRRDLPDAHHDGIYRSALGPKRLFTKGHQVALRLDLGCLYLVMLGEASIRGFPQCIIAIHGRPAPTMPVG